MEFLKSQVKWSIYFAVLYFLAKLLLSFGGQYAKTGKSNIRVNASKNSQEVEKAMDVADTMKKYNGTYGKPTEDE